MYHNVTNDTSKVNSLTVLNSSLEDQFKYLVTNNYRSFHFKELQALTEIPKKSIIITFDDVTENQLIYAIPLLKKYNLKATFFVPFSYIAKTDEWNEGAEKIMTIAQIKSLDPVYVELGHHSYKHQKYATMTDEEIQNDFDLSFKYIEEQGLEVINVLAYPYGNYPKEKVRKKAFQNKLSANNIALGLKIGNRLNRFPFKSNYEIKRIDIKGWDSFLEFKIKLRIGKLKLF